MSKVEKQLADKVDKYLKEQKKVGNLWFFNVFGNGVQRPGIPDRICCYRGYFVGIELKREDGQGIESGRQAIERQLITKAGGFSIVTENLESIKTLFKYIDSLLD